MLVPKHHVEQTRASSRATTNCNRRFSHSTKASPSASHWTTTQRGSVAALDAHRTLAEALNQQTTDLNLSADETERFHAEALQIVRRLIQLGLLERPHQDVDA